MSDADTILITGTSKGIGLALARHYVEAGRDVAGCSRGASPLDPVEGPGTYRHYQCDITDEQAVREMVTAVDAQAGGLGLLVNNAGVPLAQPGLVTSGKRLTELLEINVTGTFNVTREVVRAMLRRGSGRIVNLSSIAAQLETPGNAAYGASKAAITRLTHQLVSEVGAAGITANTVGVSLVREGGMYESLSPAARERYEARLASAEPVPIEELAFIIDFFASPEAGSITGQTLYLGGPS